MKPAEEIDETDIQINRNKNQKISEQKLMFKPGFDQEVSISEETKIQEKPNVSPPRRKTRQQQPM